MNYIAEVNSFYNWLHSHTLPTDAQALWHYLMHMNNQCAVKVNNRWYWRVEFSVSNKIAASILDFSRQQLDKMRNILIQTGRIEYRKGKGSQGGTYKIIPFDTSIVDNYVDNFPDRVWISIVSNNMTQSLTQMDTQTEQKRIHNPDAKEGLCKLYGTLTNISNNNINNIYNNAFCDDGGIARAAQPEQLSDYLSELNRYFGITEKIKLEAAQFTQELFGKYTPRQPTRRDVIQVFELVMTTNRGEGGSWKLWLDEEKKEVLEYAFGQASDSGNRTWSYIRGVLDRLRERGLKNQRDCEYYDADRDISKNRI